MLQEKVREFVQKTDSRREIVDEEERFIESEIDNIQLNLMIEKLEQTLSLNGRPKRLQGLAVKH